MRRFLPAAVLAVCFVLPSAAAETGPAAVIQTASVGRILKDVRAAAAIVAGEMGSKAIDDKLKEALGEKGLSGLDLAKPILGFVIFDDKDPENTRFVLLVPIGKEEDFMDFLKRCHLEPEEHKDAKGVYKLGAFDIPQPDQAKSYEVLMRIVGGTAYCGFNVKPDVLDAAKLPKPEQLADTTEKALLAYRQFNDRISPDVLKNNLKSFEESMQKMKESLGGIGASETVMLGALEKLMAAMTKLSFDAKETGSRLSLDIESGELSVDSYYVPKPGTDFAKALKERQPSANQFAGVAAKDSAAALMAQLPVGMKEMQDLMIAGIDTLEAKAKEEPPPFGKEMLDEALKGAKRTIKSGTWDIGVSINGPDKDGHFTVVGGMTFDDARPFEKVLKEGIKNFPAEVRESFKFEVDKVADLDMHAIDPPEGGEPEGYAKLFGDRKIYFVMGPKGIYVAIGNGAKDALKAAITGKPGPANAFDVTINPKRLGQVITAAEPNAGAMMEKILGNEDKSMSAIAFSVSGGDALRFKMSLNLKLLPRMMAQSFLAFGG